MIIYLTTPSYYIMAILDEIQHAFEDRIEIVQVKIDDGNLSPICKQQGIRLPTVRVFKQSKIIGNLPGIDEDGINMLFSLL